MQKVKGFLIQSTARSLVVDPSGPPRVAQAQMVVVEESLPKAVQAAIENCPSNMELISLSVQELVVGLKEGKNV